MRIRPSAISLVLADSMVLLRGSGDAGRHQARPAHRPTYVMSGGMQRAGCEAHHQRQAREPIAIDSRARWRATRRSPRSRQPLAAGDPFAPDAEPEPSAPPPCSNGESRPTQRLHSPPPGAPDIAPGGSFSANVLAMHAAACALSPAKRRPAAAQSTRNLISVRGDPQRGHGGGLNPTIAASAPRSAMSAVVSIEKLSGPAGDQYRNNRSSEIVHTDGSRATMRSISGKTGASHTAPFSRDL